MSLDSVLHRLLGKPTSSRVDAWSNISVAMDEADKLKALSLHLIIDLDPELISDFARKGTLHTYKQGEVIFRQGDIGDAFYLVKSGLVNVTLRQEEGQKAEVLHMEKSIVVNSIPAGRYFGEYALLDEADGRRKATVVAAT